jgi:hypothetical protein
MAYSNVTSLATMDAVLGAITTFLGGLTGWTIQTNMGTPSVGAAAGGHDTIASNGTTQIGLRSTTTGAGANVLMLFSGLGAYSTGIEGTLVGDDGMGSFYTTANVATSPLPFRGFQALVGPFPNLYMFSNAAGDYVHVVLEWATGKFRHMMFGKLTKFGTWPGGNGSYFAGSYWTQAGLGSSTFTGQIDNPSNQQSALPFDNHLCSVSSLLDWTVNYSNGTDVWIGPNEAVFGSIQHRRGRSGVRGGANRLYKNVPESLFTGLIPLGPVIVGAEKLSDTPVTIRFVGQVPDFRTVNITHLANASEFAIGSDTWKVFPLTSRGQTPGQESTLFAGLAYKKI